MMQYIWLPIAATIILIALGAWRLTKQVYSDNMEAAEGQITITLLGYTVRILVVWCAWGLLT